MKNIQDIRNELKNTKPDLDTGMVEIINASFVCDEDYILREPNEDYIQKELKWYESQSRNVNDIEEPIPEIWKQVATANGFINSNYGWCIWSNNNYNQYDNCLKQLKMDKNTRRAQMIYTRPEMQVQYNYDGMSDYMCTNTVQVLIRDNKLIYIVNMRSNDAVFGFNNDLAWHQHVAYKLINDLYDSYPDIKPTDIIWNAGSLHVYPRHLKLLKDI